MIILQVTLAFPAGALGFLIILDMILAMNGVFGMSAVGILAAVALIIIYLSVSHRGSSLVQL